MTPEETVYFANPGEAEPFNKDYSFTGLTFITNPLMIGSRRILFIYPNGTSIDRLYTIPDTADNVLKVLEAIKYMY